MPGDRDPLPGPGMGFARCMHLHTSACIYIYAYISIYTHIFACVCICGVPLHDRPVHVEVQTALENSQGPRVTQGDLRRLRVT